jgi:hypothetical protein
MNPSAEDAKIGRHFALSVGLLFLVLMALHALSEPDLQRNAGYAVQVSEAR